jgi:hypothetical protein
MKIEDPSLSLKRKNPKGGYKGENEQIMFKNLH